MEENPEPVADVVLLVDDNEVVRKSIAAALTAEGCSVVEAANGRDALRLLLMGQFTPRLIVYDLDMPEMSGLALVKVLGCYPELTKIPVILMSAGRNAPLDPLVVAPVPAFLQRPVEPRALPEIVDRDAPFAALNRSPRTRFSTADVCRAVTARSRPKAVPAENGPAIALQLVAREDVLGFDRGRRPGPQRGDRGDPSRRGPFRPGSPKRSGSSHHHG